MHVPQLLRRVTWGRNSALDPFLSLLSKRAQLHQSDQKVPTQPCCLRTKTALGARPSCYSMRPFLRPNLIQHLSRELWKYNECMIDASRMYGVHA